MRRIPICLSLACVLAFGSPPTARGDDPLRTPVALVTSHKADPCGFERTEAYGAGLMHFSTEMLWGCEAVARRRAAALPLGDRLLRFAKAMNRYEAAVATASRLSYSTRRTTGIYMPVPALTDTEKQALAESTGTLQALAEIRSGF